MKTGLTPETFDGEQPAPGGRGQFRAVVRKIVTLHLVFLAPSHRDSSWTMLRRFPCSEAAIKLETLQLYIPAELVRGRLRRGRAARAVWSKSSSFNVMHTDKNKTIYHQESLFGLIVVNEMDIDQSALVQLHLNKQTVGSTSLKHRKTWSVREALRDKQLHHRDWRRLGAVSKTWASKTSTS